jgi:ATP/maltotriose-dependent transcriptional regulator MalT
MTLSFFLHDSLDEFENADVPEQRSVYALGGKKDDFPILAEKLEVPNVGSVVHRPRLCELLDRSASQFGATLVSGRAGTGKTVLATDYAGRRKDVVWFSVDSADNDWNAFSHYFAESLSGIARRKNVAPPAGADGGLSQAAVAQFLADCFSSAGDGSEPVLIVLDNIHHVFDADWFSDFFNVLICSLAPNAHLLMLCRSRPPGPLWRLRSKQMLNVIDEKLIAFTLPETEELFTLNGLPEKLAPTVHEESFGRISKILQFANLIPNKPPGF